MNKANLVKAIAKKSKSSRREVEEIIDLATEIIVETLVEGDNVAIANFGIFEIRNRKERTGIDPNTKEIIDIAKKKYPGFRPSRTFKAKINQK